MCRAVVLDALDLLLGSCRHRFFSKTIYLFWPFFVFRQAQRIVTFERTFKKPKVHFLCFFGDSIAAGKFSVVALSL